jgi:hypothetical protein
VKDFQFELCCWFEIVISSKKNFSEFSPCGNRKFWRFSGEKIAKFPKNLLHFGKLVPNLQNHKLEGKKIPGHKGGQTTIVAFVSSCNMQTVSGQKNVESASCTLLEDLFAISQPEKEENFNSCQKALLYFI